MQAGSKNHLTQAQTLEAQGRLAEAEAAYQRIVTNNPRQHAAWHALGLIAFGAGRLEQGVKCLEAAISCDSKTALYQRNIGEMYRRLGQQDKSIQAGRRATTLAPADLDAHYNLGLAYSDKGDFERAITCYRRALKLNPRHGLSWNNLGSALEQSGDKAEALQAYQHAIDIDPRHAEAQNNAGAIHSEQGSLDEARACFEAAIAARPTFFEAHYNLSSLKKYTRDDPHLAMLEAGHAQRDRLHGYARIRYAFALGKALDDIGEYDRAFAAYEEGNRLQHALLPVDDDRADALMREIIAVFDADFFAARQGRCGGDDTGRTPIFIVGMPRSGTTLLEQILCSHASVHGAGELSDLDAVITQDGQRPYPASVRVLSDADITRIGTEYLQRVWKLSPHSRYITDKMPANFFHLGLLHLALPHAKIIHAMRDPMDSCFSCYSRLFNDTMAFAYDQGTLGRYYARYMTLMQHWHAVLPPGTILDLPYEDMVADTETQARRVLEFVGLPWDERCLKFYENDRVVRTASVAQVRKPIYKGSVARWKHFARHLRPLYEAVKAWRPADDAEALFASAPAPVAQSHLPATAEADHVEGIALYRAGRFNEALAKYQRALLANPNFPTALNSMGFVLQDMDRMEEALACFARAVELAPEFAMARLNLGMAQLKMGDWENGWENYEARWTGSAEAGDGSLKPLNCPLPQWTGEGDTARQRLLVITEQGFGDTFQFCRYLALAAGRFAKVGFVCSQPTQRLMEWAFGDTLVTFNRLPADFSAWDLQCPLMSLPRAFGTRPQTIPSTAPYLRVPEKAQAHWRERLDLAAPAGLRIGLAWAGRKLHQYDGRRSLRFQQIQALLHKPGVTWVSLQKWAPEDERPTVPEAVNWLDWTEELSDFADSAALIANLDLVISIDSVLVHLAGGLNKPVWMMNRHDAEWRWFHHRNDSPWYPQLRIFNQPAFGDWDSVLDAVQQALDALPNPRPGSGAVPPPRRPAPAVPAAPANLSIAQAMERASQLQSSGRLAEAEQLLRQILQAQPRHAHALHLLGVVAHQGGQPDLALKLITDAIALDGEVALFHSNLAEMYRQKGQLTEAIRHGEAALALDPSMATAHSNLGIAYFDAGDLERAEACQLQALVLAPNLLQALNNLGSIERERKNLKAAADCYRRALSIQPDYVEALSNLGAVLVEDNEADQAAVPLERALQLQPNFPEALCNLGLVSLKQERHDLAIALLRRSLQLRASYPEAMLGLARALQAASQLQHAHEVVHDMLQHHPQHADAWTLLGTVCVELDQSEEAEKAYRKALEIDPAKVDAMTGLGNLRLEQGRIEEAEASLNQTLTIEPDNLGALFHLVQTRKVEEGDLSVHRLEALQTCTLNDDKLISLHYALGKAYDDLKQWDRAFQHFIAGARLKRAQLDYDPASDAARTRRIAGIVDAGFIERLRGAGNPSEVPIFVLGMPRSGTTLTEQIIASHPEVHGAGELRDLMEVVQQPVAGQKVPGYPDNLSSLSPETVSAWGADYLARVRRRAPEARRITDKMPANYMALGLIPLLLPNARIVHVKRNPVDTCVSCFTRLFNRHQDATYDLAELGRHYASYARLMEHWRQVLPAGSFLEVQYEDIVADMETQARRLIDWCGLEWNDACLAFHKNTRNIRTASVAQVRKPIYNSSVERWRHYEAFLDPLFEGLAEFAPPR